MASPRPRASLRLRDHIKRGDEALIGRLADRVAGLVTLGAFGGLFGVEAMHRLR